MMKNRIIFNFFIFINCIINIFVWTLYEMELFYTLPLIIIIISNTLLIVYLYTLIKNYNILLLKVSKDPLTNIYNRTYFMETLEKEISRARRHEEALVMVMFDIDDFKKINDVCGHYAGDKTIIEITKIVKNNIRQYDTFGRLGGEEFGIILPEIDKLKSIELCERIRDDIESTKFDHKIPVTISIGLCILDKSDDHYSMYQKSDSAMYLAKDAGKNQIVVHQV